MENLTYLQRFLVIFDIVAINIMVRADGLTQLWSNDHSRTFCSRAAGEQHDPSASILERRLHQSNGDAEGDASASEAAVVVCSGPRVSLKSFQSLGKLEFSSFDREEEPRGRAAGRLHARPCGRGCESEHFLHLLRSVVLAASEDM